MPETTISMTVRTAGPGVAAIDIAGDVTSGCESALMEAFSEASSAAVGGVILNFAGLQYMNSGGIGLLVTLLIRANRQGTRLVAIGLNDHYRQIFSLTRLDEAIQIHADESEFISIHATEAGR
ncbi:MAG: STAS domain-containing protein [Tepidiformaceae bacterium]